MASHLRARVSVRHVRHGLRFSAVVARRGRYSVVISRVSRGRRVLFPIVVKRFERRRGAFTWNGRGGRLVKDGYYVAVLTTRRGPLTDVRARPAHPPPRTLLRRSHARELRALPTAL